MRSIEDWISKLLNQDIKELNGQYTAPNYGSAENEVDLLPDIEPMRYGESKIDADLL